MFPISDEACCISFNSARNFNRARLRNTRTWSSGLLESQMKCIFGCSSGVIIFSSLSLVFRRRAHLSNWDAVISASFVHDSASNPGKVRLLRMTHRRCVVRKRCEGDGPLMCVKLYLEYIRKIFQLILHSGHVHYLTRIISPSQVPCAHDPACKAVHMVSVQN